MAEIAADRGESVETILRETGESVRMLLAAFIGIPPSQIVQCEFQNIDEAMPGKVALVVNFDPMLTPAQIKIYKEAVHAISAMSGCSPPMWAQGKA